MRSVSDFAADRLSSDSETPFIPCVHVRSLSTGSSYLPAHRQMLEQPESAVTAVDCSPRVLGGIFGVLFEDEELSSGGTLILRDYIQGNIRVVCYD